MYHASTSNRHLNSRAKWLKIALGLVAVSAFAAPCQALVIGPYATDANTLHLYHFNETDGNANVASVATFNDSGSGVTTNLADNRGLDGATAFSGFGNSFDVEAGGVSASQSPNLGRAATTASAGAQSLWQGASGAFTYELLVSTSSITTGNQILMTRDGIDGSRGWIMSIVGGNLQFIPDGFATSAVAIPTTGLHAFVPDAWFHVAVAYNGAENTAGNAKFYWTRVDDQFTQANLIGSPMFATDAVAGASNLFGVGAFTRGPWRLEVLGKVDEVRISNVARTADQFIFAVPEPSSFAMLLVGGMVMWMVGRKRT